MNKENLININHYNYARALEFIFDMAMKDCKSLDEKISIFKKLPKMIVNSGLEKSIIYILENKPLKKNIEQWAKYSVFKFSNDLKKNCETTVESKIFTRELLKYTICLKEVAIIYLDEEINMDKCNKDNQKKSQKESENHKKLKYNSLVQNKSILKYIHDKEYTLYSKLKEQYYIIKISNMELKKTVNKLGEKIPLSLNGIYGVPYIPASSIKGGFRDFYEFENNDKKTKQVFGENDSIGELVFFDTYPLGGSKMINKDRKLNKGDFNFVLMLDGNKSEESQKALKENFTNFILRYK